jgi:hypothetical protein
VKGPETKEEWLEEIYNMEVKLSLQKTHKLSPYIMNVFIPVERIDDL